MIEAVLFDFGGVFTRSPFDALQAACVDLGIDPEVGLRVVFGSYHEDTDHPWHRVERGELSLEGYRDEARAEAAASGFDIDPIRVLAALGSGGSDGGVIRNDVVEVVRAVRAGGRRTALVTNNALELRDLWRPLLPLDELFDTVVDSSEVGIRKPTARIYELTLELLGDISPEAAVFLDDAEGNIAGAERVGMRGILVGTDHRPAIAELEGLLADGDDPGRISSP
jgi:putative hydrolase of the HAD superfamily